MEDSTLIDKPLSPERGQLLISLIKSDLDTLTLQEIYRSADFSYADLKGLNLKGVRLVGANLHHSNFHNATLENADMRHTDLRFSNLNDAKIAKVDFGNASLDGIELKRSSIFRDRSTDSSLRLNRHSNSISWANDTSELSVIWSFALKGDTTPNFNNARIDCGFFERIISYSEDSIYGTYKILEQYQLNSFTSSNSYTLCIMRKGN